MGSYRMSTAGKWMSGVIGGAGVTLSAIYVLTMPPQAASADTTATTVSGQGHQVAEVAQPAPPPPPQKQVTTMWGIEQSGRMYALWNGYVVEDNENKTGYLPSDNSFDKNVYDFDLGLILHTTSIVQGASPGALSRTLFSELAVGGKVPPHIDNVRKIGCDIVKIFEDNHASGKYGPPPGDVMSYKQRHCQPPAAPPAPR